ncbi:MAG: Glycosyl transferase family 2 [Planctomycetes bacterium ADurb.Bin412]|nr:MAG: Glycosyl transferase family 2 [Planctomycetes bacterium ADurb.Bin412]
MLLNVKKFPMNINAAIVAYNRPQSLCALIAILQAQTVPVARIFVVDNSTSDAVREALVPYLGQIGYVKTAENMGSAGGFRMAVELALPALLMFAKGKCCSPIWSKHCVDRHGQVENHICAVNCHNCRLSATRFQECQ